MNAMLVTSIGKYESFLRATEAEAAADADVCECGECEVEEPIVESENVEEE